MSNLRNSLEKVFNQKKQLARLEKAKQKFEFKTFSEQYAQLYGAINYGRGLFHLFSILTAFTFLFLLLDSFIQLPLVSGALSALILVFWEYVKSTVLQNSFYSYYRRGLNLALVAVAVVMLAGSVYTSLRGARSYAELNDTSITDFKADARTKIDSINAYYNLKIGEVKTELSEFKKSVSYKGKINVYNKTVQSTINVYNSQLARLADAQEKAIASMEVNSSNTLVDVESKAEFNLLAFICLSAINEMLIVVCAWFLVFFEFKLVQDSEVFTPSEKYELDAPSLNRLVQLARGTAPSLQVHARLNENSDTKPSIGFKPIKNGGLNVQNSDHEYLQKYSEVVRMIEQGSTENQILDSTDISRSTLYNIKRILKNL